MTDILEGDEVTIIGMSLDDEDSQFNSYFFNHDSPNCNTTFTMNVLEFSPYIDEPIAEEILAGQAGCEQHCTNRSDTQPCGQNCRWAPFRRLMSQLMIRKMKRATAR